MASFEQHYSPIQLAKLWGVSHDTIQRLFQDEPGVFALERPEQMNKRRYTSMRIPASIATRVYERYLNKEHG